MLTLSLPGEEATRAMLQQGHSYCLIVRSESQRMEVLRQLGGQAGAVVVPDSGGLISNLPVWENIVLPVQYHGLAVAGSLEENVVELLLRCGVPDQSVVSELLLRLPDQLSLLEKRMVGFVRAMLMAPELLIYDSMLEGLSQEEQARAISFDRVFRLYFPFRTSVLVSFEEYHDEHNPKQRIIQL